MAASPVSHVPRRENHARQVVICDTKRKYRHRERKSTDVGSGIERKHHQRRKQEKPPGILTLAHGCFCFRATKRYEAWYARCSIRSVRSVRSAPYSASRARLRRWTRSEAAQCYVRIQHRLEIGWYFEMEVEAALWPWAMTAYHRGRRQAAATRFQCSRLKGPRDS